MWGGRENESQKGMNFATVAGGGVSVNTSGSSSSKFIDSVPPQVDASKAPGYRGTTMCSPVSSKSNNNTTNANASNIGSGGSSNTGHNPIQPPQFQSSGNYNEHPLSNKPPGSLAVARPVIPQQSIEMSAAMGTQYNRPVFQGELTSRNASTHQAHVIAASSSQATFGRRCISLNRCTKYAQNTGGEIYSTSIISSNGMMCACHGAGISPLTCSYYIWYLCIDIIKQLLLHCPKLNHCYYIFIHVGARLFNIRHRIHSYIRYAI